MTPLFLPAVLRSRPSRIGTISGGFPLSFVGREVWALVAPALPAAQAALVVSPQASAAEVRAGTRVFKIPTPLPMRIFARGV